ncbi:hypothetical protein [uncultured Roseibium sp.]|uniref:hypothetical protein n=1 Tax=uncultured Roseibium sp. TaxID=1936171 RepID=UPI00261F5583|nr:hypothetical protein [uncultured Roseibium sp.]
MSIRDAYVHSLDITDFVKDQFSGEWDAFFQWKDSVNDMDELEEKRSYLINVRIAGAMAKQAAQGNANASKELARLTGQIRPVGRPPFKAEIASRVEHELAKEKRAQEEFEADLERMSNYSNN